MFKPGLIRMLLVNHSLLNGRIDEVPLDEHTIFLSENTSGKTSTMSLVPFFWGAEPNEIVSQKNKSFVEFYLPTEASYLCFEYRNHRGELKSVVIHPSNARTGERSVQYRFINGGLSISMFLTGEPDGEGQEFVKTVDFEAHLKTLGYDPASRLVLSTSHYRGIIQGRHELIPRAEAGLMRFVDTFGVGRRDAPLKNIEKLFLATLNNKFSLRDFLSVVAGYASNSGKDTKISIFGSDRQAGMETRPREYEAYLGAMGLEDRFGDVARERAEAEAARDSYAQLYGALSLRADELAEQELELKNSVKIADAALADLRNTAQISMSDVVARQTQTERSLQSAQAELKGMEDKEGVFLRDKADQAQSDVEKIPAIESEIETLTIRKRTLTEKGQDALKAVRDGHEDTKAVIDASHAEQMSVFNTELDLIRQASMAAAAAIDADMTRAQEDHEAEIAALNTRLNAALDEAEAKKDADADAYQGATAPMDLTQAVEAAAQTLRERKANLSKEEAAAEQNMRAERQADALCSETEKAMTEAKAAAVRAAEEKERRFREYQPDEKTLLGFLRKQDPAKIESFAKVVNPDLLNRTDLTPSLVDEDTACDSVFGVSLKLSSLDVLFMDDEEDLEKRFLDAARAEEDALKNADEKATAAKKAKAAHHAAKEASDKIKKSVDLLRGQVRNAENTWLTADNRAKTALQDVRKGLSERLDASKAAVLALKTQKRDAEMERTRKSSEIRTSHNALKRESDASFNGKLNDVRKRISELNAETKSRHSRNDEALRQAERGHGADPREIETIQKALADAANAVSHAKSRVKAAQDWAYHVEFTRPTMVQRKAEIESLRSLSATIKAEREALQTRQDAAERDARALIQETTDRLARISKDAQSARIFLDHPDNLIALPTNIASIRASADVSAAMTELRDLQQTVKSREEKSGKMMGRLLEEMKSKEGPVGQFFKVRHGGDREAGFAAMRDWFGGEHEAIRDTILETLRAACLPLSASFKILREANKQARLAGSRLSKQISEIKKFRNIKSVDLRVKSALTEQPFWLDFEAFHDAYEKVNLDLNRDEKDITTLNNRLIRLMSHWKHEMSPAVDLRDILYIEGQIHEGDQVHKLTQGAKLESMSSEGGQTLIRLILLCAAVNLIRGGRDVSVVWCVDEIGKLDQANSMALCDLLTENGIVLVTAAPDANAKVVMKFRNRLKFQRIGLTAQNTPIMGLLTYGDPKSKGAQNAVREWNADNTVLGVPMKNEDDAS